MKKCVKNMAKNFAESKSLRSFAVAKLRDSISLHTFHNAQAYLLSNDLLRLSLGLATNKRVRLLCVYTLTTVNSKLCQTKRKQLQTQSAFLYLLNLHRRYYNRLLKRIGAVFHSTDECCAPSFQHALSYSASP